MYGREPEDWETLSAAGHEFLMERARLRRDTSYTEMNTVLATRTGLRLFDFAEASDRAAMGYLLGLIVEDTYPQLGCMLSSIVVYLNENDAGPGFYALARQLGLIQVGASKSEQETFWVGQMNAVFAIAGSSS